MTGRSDIEPMLDIFYFETRQYLEQLEQLIINSEKASCFSEDAVNEVFRVMHNIKSSAAMMLFANISILAHTIEDLFFFLREQKPQDVDCAILSDLVLEGVDFIKIELEKIKNGDAVDGDNTALVNNIQEFLAVLKELNHVNDSSDSNDSSQIPRHQYYISKDINAIPFVSNIFRAQLYFQDGCEMENIRAYALVHNLKDIAHDIHFIPDDIIENDDSAQVIKEHGFKVWFKTDRTYDELQDFFDKTAFIRDLELTPLQSDDEIEQLNINSKTEIEEKALSLETVNECANERVEKDTFTNNVRQSMISVNVNKLDALMDLVGEIVIAEAMVTQNPDLKDLKLDNFKKAARHLRKITSEVQDIVMSIRMVPLTVTFQRMNRIVRDMSKKLNKEVVLEIIGEETEVDKNIIEHISDPLMHLVRNAIDHGIESNEERRQRGKTDPARVTLEARNAGNEVLVIVKDNGRGLDKEKILKKAAEHGLIHKPSSEMTEREIFNLILLPGFSTRDNISEFSGRGVGMDVVAKNIEAVGGSVQVESVLHEGTTITMKIPLTLAIIGGMNIKVGKSCYTIPTTSIKEAFRPQANEIITDPDGNEMIMVRGQCYPIIRLHKAFNVKTNITDFAEGIIIMIENGDKIVCLFADAILGEQQVVVKALPNYFKKIRGLAGCTLLGDGNISLILDVAGIYNMQF